MHELRTEKIINRTRFVFATFIMLTGFSSLKSNAAAPVYLSIFAATAVYFLLAMPGRLPLALFGLTMAAFIVFTHRANIQRMRAGNENRARRLWLLRPR